MFRFSGIRLVVASLGLAALAGACTTPDNGVHQHGPRGEPMKDSAMPGPATNCPGQGGSQHTMPGPRGGTMPDAAHPGCPSAGAKDTQPKSN
jgi:hypothetical protein